MIKFKVPNTLSAEWKANQILHKNFQVAVIQDTVSICNCLRYAGEYAFIEGGWELIGDVTFYNSRIPMRSV